MANKKLDDEQRKLLEKRELLKLKQGLVEESDIVEIDKPQEKVELHGWKKVENFFYHYKWRVIVLTVVAFFVGIMVCQTVFKEKNDLYILTISTTNQSGLYVKTDDIEKALERYCPDFDGNGYVHVGVNNINLSTETGISDFTDSEQLKFTSEITTGDAQMYIADEGVVALFEEMGKGEIQYFNIFTEQYPDAALYEGQGLQLNTTEFTDFARWASCPDMVGVYVRGEYPNMVGNDEEAQEQRRRAMEVFDNIVNGNVVNPAPEEK